MRVVTALLLLVFLAAVAALTWSILWCWFGTGLITWRGCWGGW